MRRRGRRAAAPWAAVDQAKRKHLQRELHFTFGMLLKMQRNLSLPLLDLARRRPHVLLSAGEQHRPAVPSNRHGGQRCDPRQPPRVWHLAAPPPTNTAITAITAAAAAAAAATATATATAAAALHV